MQPRRKLALTLWLGGSAGVLSSLLIDLNSLIALLPPDKIGGDLVITPAIRLLSLLQPTLFVTIAVAVGIFLAPRVGLSAPLLEAWTNGTRSPLPATRHSFLPGLLGGALGTALILVTSELCAPHLPPAAAPRIAEFLALVPPLTRLLYGGITEEILLRWGLMTFLVWSSWRLFQKHRPQPTTGNFVAAILVSSLIFAAGHLPVALLVVPDPTPGLIAFVLIANACFGLVAGHLYWKRGLESAIIAHVTTHVLLMTASRVGLYFH